MTVTARPSPLKRATRSAALTSAALVTAGAVALAPLSPVATAQAASSAPVVSVADYDLTAAWSPVDAWTRVVDQSGTNLNFLGDFLRLGPFDLGQTIAANQLDNLADLPDILTIANRTWNNLTAGLSAPFAEDLTTMGSRHRTAYRTIPAFTLPPLAADAWQRELLALTTTSTTGVLLGVVGPIVGPVVALANSLGASFDNLTEGEIAQALSNLVDIPANMTGAFLNGGPSVNIKPLLGLLGINLNPAIFGDAQIRLVFGGVLSTGTSMFAGLTGTAPLAMNGNGSGAIASAMHLTQQITGAIGGNTRVLDPVVVPDPPRPTGDTEEVSVSKKEHETNVLQVASKNPLKALKLAAEDAGDQITALPGKTEKSLTKATSTITEAFKGKDGVSAGLKEIGNQVKYRVERLKKDIDNGLTKVGLKKEKKAESNDAPAS